MKYTILIVLLGFLGLIPAKGRTDKNLTGIYQKTLYQATEDGAYVQVDIKGDDGKEVSFVESAETFMANTSKKIAFIEKGSSFGDVTNKKFAGQKFSITYFVNDAGTNVIKSFYRVESSGGQFTPAMMDSVFKATKKAQDVMRAKHKCPDCPVQGAKEFMKKRIAEIDKQLPNESNPRHHKELVETKEYLQAALVENKFLTYFFTDKRASVLVQKKFGGNGRYIAIQMKKDGEWAGLGLDDSWTSCKELKKEDEVSMDNATNCGIYFNRMLKDGK